MKKQRKSSSNKNITTKKGPISKSKFINLIFQNYFENNDPVINNKFIEYNFLSRFKIHDFGKIFHRTNFISKTNNKYIISRLKYNKLYLPMFSYIIHFIIEGKKNFFKINNKLLINNYIMILIKLYKQKILDKNNLLIIIEFISLLSIYERKDFLNVELPKTRIIKNYQIFKKTIDIIKQINEKEITSEYLNFINNNITKYKVNLFIITEKTDILELINIDPNEQSIIHFLANLYSFKYSKSFLDVFIKQIKDSYDIKNKNKSTFDILELLKGDLNLLKAMQELELKRYNEDPFIQSLGFVICNNSDKFSAVVKEIIIKEQFTMVFSFCYSPDEKINNNSINNMHNSINTTTNTNNISRTSKLKKEIGIPIIELIKEDSSFNEISGFSFFIQGGYLYHRQYNSSEEIKLCEIEINKTYMCYYSILELDHYIINVKSPKDTKLNGTFVKKEIKFLLKNKLKLQIGKFCNQANSSFDGYIGPILLFNTCLNNEYRKNIFILKGSYDKMLYFDNINFKFVDKYDKDMNFPFLNEINDKDNYNNFSVPKNFFSKESNKIYEALIYNLTPIYQSSSLTKKDFTNSFLKEYKINFNLPPNPHTGNVFFFKNVPTPMEFLKYEGINFLIMIFELITSNLDNLNIQNIENDKITILNLFSNLIPYIKDLIFLLKIDYYQDDIRHILFALEKCVNKLCIKFKMSNEIGHELNNWIKSLTLQTSPYIKSYIKIRNEISKFLLDPKLYNLKDYASIEIFFVNLNYCMNLRPEGLMNMEIFFKILLFTGIYKTVTKRKDIRKTQSFKGFKKEMNKILITFFRKCGFIKPYERLIELLSDSMNYNFKKYQLLKIFYLESKYYFDNIQSEKSIILTWKYFIELFKYLQAHDSFEDITQKQANILMALSLRIIIEYPTIGNIFKENKYMSKKKNLNNENEENFKKINNNNSTNKNNKYKRSSSFSKTTKGKLKNLNITFNEKGQEGKEKRKNSFDLIQKEENSVSSNFLGYADFFTYKTLINKLNTSFKLNDYILRALFLLILETNNNVIISQEIKLKFITKIKKFDDFKNKDYSSFLKLNYINREVKKQLINLVHYIEKNTDYITHISYDIFLYLILNICENREKNKCAFNHLASSKKICAAIFLCAMNHDKEAYNLIFKYFLELTSYILPYHKRPFLTDFLYELLTDKNQNLRNYGRILINMMLVTNLQNVKEIEHIYYMKMNSISLIYRIIKTKDFASYINEINFSDKGLVELFNIELITTKINIFKNILGINKKKSYAEALFEIILFMHTKFNNKDYFDLLEIVFMKNLKLFKGADKSSETIISYIDTIKGQSEKGNKAIKIFSKPESIEVPCLCIQFLLKTLKYRYRCNDEETKKYLNGLCIAFYNDAYLVYSKHSSKKKKFKSKIMYNFLYDFVKTDVSKKTKRGIKELISSFSSRYRQYLEEKEKKNIDKKNRDERKTTLSLLSFQGFNFFKSENEEETLNDSFASCKSIKDVKVTCYNNKKKICKSVIKRSNIVKKLYKKYMKNDIIDLEEVDEELFPNPVLQEKQKTENDSSKQKNNLNMDSKEYIKNLLANIDSEDNPFSLDTLETINKVILFPKPVLLEQVFAIFFIERLFYNKPFVKMKKFYKYFLMKKYEFEISTKNFFNYPIIMKNYIPNNLYFGGLFLKHDLDFFENRYFKISHSYYSDRQKESIPRRIFAKISEQKDVDRFLEDKRNDKRYTFYVDLVTNRNVVFGILFITKNLIFFQNLDKNGFIQNKKEEEKTDWLLCSQDCDYSKRNKKLYIFKNEITEIINRRFLYLFQACEIYLKNGKSYYFNFYSEEKKIEFISIFSQNKGDIKIISDLKTEFKNKGFTKQWLNNQITTLAYLLFINKYSCRSYNDVNQYPVFPWLILYGDKERDLRYTIAAQDEDSRMKLKEMYGFSSPNFPYHYTTHYSNASFLIYYLIRINPFTDNQITLQVDKFDVPDRQFNSLDEIQKILYSTSQPREVIPEFFISTEFFYNYNCNFFGPKNNTKFVINDLINKKGFNSPLEYVLNNEVLLESPKFKSQINFFFDNIFGVGQMGGRDNCNTFDKYSYQEMIDLNQKIRKFKEQKLSYQEIKTNIERKSNKIISFGQTPFKLLEDKHPQWNPEKKNTKDNINIDDNFNDMKERFLYFNIAKNSAGKSVFYILVNNEHLAEIKFYDKKIKDTKDIKVIKTKKVLKLCSKIYLDQQSNKNKSFVSLYKYNPKFIMINFNFSIFIFGRLRESCFCIFNKAGDSVSYCTESIVICIEKSKEYNFFTGLKNGKIFEFKLINIAQLQNNNANINLNELKIDLVRSYLAHKDKVNGIYYSELLGLIISSGADKKIYIRKYYDLTLLTMINIDNKFCIDIKINHYYLYILLYDEIKKSHVVKVYSVNGIVVGKIKHDMINNICFDKNGNLMVGYALDKKINIYNPSLTKKIEEIDLSQPTYIKLKKNKVKEIKVQDTFFLNFVYQADNSSIYCYFSNGNLIQKCLDIIDKGDKNAK